MNGGDASVRITAAEQSNVDPDPVAPTDVVVVGHDPEAGTIVIGVIAYEPGEDGFDRRRWFATVALWGEPIEGATYSLAPVAAPTPGDAMLSYTESPSGGGFRAWTATAGQLTVDALAGRRATLTVGPASMVVEAGGSGNGAEGTFTLTADVTVDDLDDVATF